MARSAPCGVLHRADDFFADAAVAEVVFFTAGQVEGGAALFDAVDDQVVAVAPAGPADDVVPGDAAGGGGLVRGLGVAGFVGWGAGAGFGVVLVIALAGGFFFLAVHLVADEASADGADGAADDGALAGLAGLVAENGADAGAGAGADERAVAGIGLAARERGGEDSHAEDADDAATGDAGANECAVHIRYSTQLPKIPGGRIEVRARRVCLRV